jgi:microcystin-dependent protein
MVVQWVTSTAPTGWLLCNGNAYNASTSSVYQELYNVIGNQFGGTNNTDFKVPDYRGMFLRGAGTNAQTGYTTYVGQTLNTQQTHATQTHSHTIDHDHEDGNGPRHKFRIRSDGLSGVGFDIICSYPTNTSYTATGLQVPTHTGSSGNNTINIDANETRPVSYSVNYLIKY